VRIEGPSAIVERRVAARAQISAIFTSAEYLLNHCRDYLRREAVHQSAGCDLITRAWHKD
jgi:hypothetical protein